MIEDCIFFYRHKQKLNCAVDRSIRFLQLNAPKECDVDLLIFGGHTSLLL